MPHPSAPRRPPWRSHAWAVAALLIPAAIVGGLFLGLYLLDGYDMPIGFDTPRHLSETELVAEHGLGEVVSLAPPPSRVLADRIGRPVLTLAISGLLSTSTFAVAAVLPAIAAISVGLSAGALASRILDRRPWTLFVVAVVTGASPAVVRLAAPEAYTETLVAAAMFLAALTLIAGSRAGPAVAGAALLLAVAGLSHWQFFLVMVAMLAVAAVSFLPRSRRERRNGEAILRTPTGRIVAAVGGAAILWAVLLFGVVGTGLDSFQISIGILREKLSADLPIYRFPLTLPLAAIGGASLWMRGRGEDRAPHTPGEPARVSLAVVAAWAGLTAASIGLLLLGVTWPAHRLLAFFLGLPILTGIGLLAIGNRASRSAGRVVGGTVVLLGVAALLLLSTRTYYETFPRDRGVRWLDRDGVRQVSTAARYLREMRISPDRPIVFLVDDAGPQPSSFIPLMAYVVRSALPAEYYQRTYLYVGDPDAFLQGRPTLRRNPPSYDRTSRAFFDALHTVLDRDPVALLPSAMNPAYEQVTAAHPGWVVGPGLAVVRGPHPTERFAVPPHPAAPRGLLDVGALGIASFAIVLLAGAGWAMAGERESFRWFEVAALAPALGLATIVVTGVLIDAAGPTLTGLPGALVAPIAAAAGLLAAVIGGRSAPDRTTPSSRYPPPDAQP